jgi:uncharacterized cupredoxin-like copper-binding protein
VASFIALVFGNVAPVTETRVRQRRQCFDHPHRDTEERCDRCGRPFCEECLTPGARRPDGTRGWYCSSCLDAVARAEQAQIEGQTLGGQLARLRQAALVALGGIAVLALVGVLATLTVRFFGQRAQVGQVEDAQCGDLTRIRSVGAIGVPGAGEAVNILAYPHRAEARVFAVPPRVSTAGGNATIALDPESGFSDNAAALVDECPGGWRSPDGTTLPVSLLLDSKREGSWVQRVALWQDPAAPRGAWVRDFEVWASPSDSGDDFRRLIFDRPAQLQASVEQQWFELVQPPRSQGSTTFQVAPQERGRFDQAFPDPVPVRRLVVRVLSTYGSVEAGSQPAGVAIGEVAAYGPDLEVVFGDAGETQTYVVAPRQINALAGRPMFIMFMNQSKVDAHVFATAGQDRNVELRAEAGQIVSGQFIAASRPGRYEFYCKVIGHDKLGLVGSVIVR